jgi:hypothetical protein
MNDQNISEAVESEDSYPLKATAALINERFGLFLSKDQQRGLATGLFIGIAVGAAVIAWNVGGAIRRRL